MPDHILDFLDSGLISVPQIKLSHTVEIVRISKNANLRKRFITDIFYDMLIEN